MTKLSISYEHGKKEHRLSVFAKKEDITNLLEILADSHALTTFCLQKELDEKVSEENPL